MFMIIYEDNMQHMFRCFSNYVSREKALIWFAIENPQYKILDIKYFTSEEIESNDIYLN